MKKMYIAALLSALVFPGAGQIYNREPLKGVGYIVLTIAGLVTVVSLIIISFFRAVEHYAGYGPIWALWGKELTRSGPTIILCLVGLFCVWVVSIIDAYVRAGRGR
jgi:TM2 domain-containing membrane protein YozV